MEKERPIETYLPGHTYRWILAVKMTVRKIFAERLSMIGEVQANKVLAGLFLLGTGKQCLKFLHCYLFLILL